MRSHFEAGFFVGNRRRLRERVGDSAPIVVTANGLLQRSADTTMPFAQDRNFWYLTGLDKPDLVLVMTEAQTYLILPPSNAVRDVFDGALDTAALSVHSGVSSVLSAREGQAQLVADIRRAGRVHTLKPPTAYHRHYAFYANPARQRLWRKLSRAVATTAIHDVRSEIAYLRARKQPAEIEAIKTAVAVTTEVIDELRQADRLRQFTYEYALEAALGAGFRARGASGHAYTPIIASGPHATTLHYVDNSGRLHAGELLVVDVGAEVECYAADITRTLSLQPPSDRQQAVLDAVKDVQQAAAAFLQPGVDLKTYENYVATQMGRALVRLGLATNPDDRAALRRYYPHATSHFLGLDVHDVGDYSAPLEPGMVLTCEPGIYIPEEGIGVRLEDDLLVTKTGTQNLSGDCAYDAYVL